MPQPQPGRPPALAGTPGPAWCGYCGAPLPAADGSGRRHCGRTHKRKAQERRRRSEAAEAGCWSKLAFATIEEAAASGYLGGSVRAVRRCRYCPCYHLTRNTRGSRVVLVRRPPVRIRITPGRPPAAIRPPGRPGVTGSRPPRPGAR
jgi:hypothetical protein